MGTAGVTTAAAKIEELLKRAMGLHAASIGSASVERAVRVRLAACGTATVEEYWERLKGSRGELQELIEVVVVPETWFSRDREAFAELTRIAREEWRPNRPAAVRRLLSVPCSTGEEPYSMAMALLDADFSPDRFVIDAVDISERSLAQAKRGVYGKNSFRGSDLAFRDRYFEPVTDGHRANDVVRRSVRFRQGNVLADDFLAGAEPYDAIFCRNLLIYFDDATQDRTIATLRRMLADDGMLFVGPAEASTLIDHDLVSAKVPLAFAFRKAPPRAEPRMRAVPAAAAPVQKKSEKRAAPRKLRAVERTEAPGPSAPNPSTPVPPSRIEEAFALANQGRLAEAAALCEEEMRRHGPSAAAFYLQGLICSADGRLSAADRCYRKALYLDQNHHDALVHLALLLEQQGDPHGAKLLRGRAQKL
jgi:chemotaxis protein methyltransferase WspC